MSIQVIFPTIHILWVKTAQQRVPTLLNTYVIKHMCWMNPTFPGLMLFEETVQSVDSSHQLLIDFSGLAN